jgi:hypothetical protein
MKSAGNDHRIRQARKAKRFLNLALLMAGLNFVPQVFAQTFSIGSVELSNSVVQVTFPGRADSYYFLNAAPTLGTPSLPVAVALGANASQSLQAPIGGAPALFFRVHQIPLTSTNSLLGDGIPDGWKLQHGLNVFGPSVAGQVPFGDKRAWSQIYQADAAAASLPLAFFPQTSVTNLAGSSNVTLQVSFTEPFTGALTYQVGGTAVPNTATPDLANGDYLQPSGVVNVTNATQAAISINLVSRSAVETDRTLLVALSAQPSPGYTIATNNLSNASLCKVRLAQSTNGVYVGSLAFANALFAKPLGIKMTVRPITINGLKTFASIFDTGGSSIFGKTFSVPTTWTNSFQLAGTSYSQALTNTPFGHNVNLTLTFGTTHLAPRGSYVTPVTLTISNLTSSGRPYVGSGNLTLARFQ